MHALAFASIRSSAFGIIAVGAAIFAGFSCSAPDPTERTVLAGRYKDGGHLTGTDVPVLDEAGVPVGGSGGEGGAPGGSGGGGGAPDLFADPYAPMTGEDTSKFGNPSHSVPGGVSNKDCRECHGSGGTSLAIGGTALVGGAKKAGVQIRVVDNGVTTTLYTDPTGVFFKRGPARPKSAKAGARNMNGPGVIMSALVKDQLCSECHSDGKTPGPIKLP